MKNDLKTAKHLMLSEKTPSGVQDAYNFLYVNVNLAMPDKVCRTLLFTSPAIGEGKSVTAINAGIAFAQHGAKVLLIDCNLRNPVDDRLLGARSEVGISDLFEKKCNYSAIVHHLNNGLDFIAAGNFTNDPVKLFSSPLMKQLLEKLETYYQYIILDSPDVNNAAETVELATAVGGVLLVCRKKVSRQAQISSALDKLKFASANILGFVYTGEKH